MLSHMTWMRVARRTRREGYKESVRQDVRPGGTLTVKVVLPRKRELAVAARVLLQEDGFRWTW